MLFHITQTHSPDVCPYGKGGFESLHNDKAEGVNVVAKYAAHMEHTIYFIVEADTLEAIHQFLLPGLTTCTAKITPVRTTSI